MAGQVERQPVVAEESGLEASSIRHGHDKQTTGDKKRRGMAQSHGWPAKVLKRMPEDDRGPGTAHIFDFGVTNVGSGCMRLQTDGLAAVPHEGRGQSSIAGPHIEDWAWRQYPLQPGGKRAAGAPKHNVSEARESAGRGAIPGVIGLSQLCIAWPRRSGRHGAPGAQYPAVTPVISAVEPVATPSAFDGGRRRGARICQGVVGPSRRRAAVPASLRAERPCSRVRQQAILLVTNGPSPRFGCAAASA
jgi:hypothetical protein